MPFRRRSAPDKVGALGAVPLFQGLSARQLEQIVQHADEVPMRAGTTLAEEGKTGLELVFLLDGEAEVSQGGASVNQLGPGDFFGEIALLDGGPRTATVTAKTDLNLLVVHKNAFDHLLEAVPGLQQEILLALCAYLRRAESA